MAAWTQKGGGRRCTIIVRALRGGATVALVQSGSWRHNDLEDDFSAFMNNPRSHHGLDM